jgi:hypothetical protein
VATRPADPLRRRLVEVRRALLRLHKALIDSERAVYETREGSTSSGRFLQLLLHDPFFAWLRPYSGLLASIDQALAADDGVDPAAARAFLDELRAMVGAPAEGGASRYEEARQRDPDVLFAHVQLVRHLREPPPGDQEVA